MINRKRCLAVLLALMVLCPYILVPSFAAETVLQIRPPAEPVSAGEEFEVLVEIEGNPGFNVMQFILQYDHDLMACEDIEIGEKLNEMMYDSNPESEKGAIVAAITLDAVHGDGQIAIFRFIAKQEITNFEFSLGETIISDEEDNEFVYEVKIVPVEIDTPIATETPVESPVPGDNSEPNDVTAPPMPTPPEQTESPISSPGFPDEPNIPEETPDLLPPETMPTAEPEQTETVAQTESNAPGETDVPAIEYPTFQDTVGHWGEDFIARAVMMGLFKGYNAERFGPDDDVTRAQFVTVLYRHAESPEVVVDVPFQDISDQLEEFQRAISWAYSNGYINGRSETIFDPTGSLTRQEAMKILYGYAGVHPGMEAIFTNIYDAAFVDSDEIADWAKKPMYWAYYNEIINGTSETTLSPMGKATRAQLAKILVNYIDDFE